MANVQGIAVGFKDDAMASVLEGNTVKAALILVSADLTGGTLTTYDGTGEVSGTGYTAGGVNVTANTVGVSSSTAYWTPGGSITYTGVTLATAFDAVQLYVPSGSITTNVIVGLFTFGSATVTGNFTLTMPTNDGATALVRLT
jgi:hypothetical protein